MAFTTLTFMCIFLPIFILGYKLLPEKLGKVHLREWYLIAFSLIFYKWNSSFGQLIMLIVGITGIDFILGLLMNRVKAQKFRKMLLVFGCLFSTVRTNKSPLT